jgi:murein DD-endopeptidase MepM/ murein hydrolase activator NlpD
VRILALAALPLAATVAAPPAPTADPHSFRLTKTRVAPARAFFGAHRVRIRFRFAADGPLDLRVEIVRRSPRRVVRRFLLRGAAPRTLQRVSWDGVPSRGRAAPEARYRVRIVPVGGLPRRAGSFVMHSHFFPVRGPHWTRGPIGEFGAPRSGGRRHEGFDVVAACGTPLAAARAGRVTHNAYDPVLYGNLLIVHGRKSHRDYWYAHLAHHPRLRPGATVRTGRRIGRVGATGNARTVGCHLHFEIHSRGRPIDPRPELRRWDAYS